MKPLDDHLFGTSNEPEAIAPEVRALLAVARAKTLDGIPADAAERPFEASMNAISFSVLTILDMGAEAAEADAPTRMKEYDLGSMALATVLGSYLGARFCCTGHLLQELSVIASKAATIAQATAAQDASDDGLAGTECKGTA